MASRSSNGSSTMNPTMRARAKELRLFLDDDDTYDENPLIHPCAATTVGAPIAITTAASGGRAAFHCVQKSDDANDLEDAVAYRLSCSASDVALADLTPDLSTTAAIATAAGAPFAAPLLLPRCSDSYHSSFIGFQHLIGSEENDLSQAEYAKVQKLVKFPTTVHRSNGLGLSRPFWYLISDFNILSRQLDADTLLNTSSGGDVDLMEFHCQGDSGPPDGDGNLQGGGGGGGCGADGTSDPYSTTTRTPKSRVAQLEMFKSVSNVIHYYISSGVATVASAGAGAVGSSSSSSSSSSSAHQRDMPIEHMSLPGGTLQLMMSQAAIDTITSMKRIGYSWASVKKQAQHSANYLQRAHEAFCDFQRRFGNVNDARLALKCGDQEFIGLPARLDLDDQCRKFKKYVSQSKSNIDKQTAERKAKTQQQLQSDGVMPSYKDWLQVVAYCNHVVDAWAKEQASVQERQWVVHCYSLLLYNECLGSRPGVLPNVTWGCFVAEPAAFGGAAAVVASSSSSSSSSSSNSSSGSSSKPGAQMTYHLKFSAREKSISVANFTKTTHAFMLLTKRMLTLSWYGTKPRYHEKEPGRLSDNNKAAMGAEKLLKRLDKAGIRDDQTLFDPASLRFTNVADQ